MLYYHEWLRTKHTSMSKDEEAKLLYGMLFTLKSFVNELSPAVPKEGFLSYKTSKYRLNFFETVSRLKFILNTDNETSQTEIRELMAGIYTQIYVEYASKSPMVTKGEVITSNLFRTKVNQFVQASPFFKAN